MKALALGLMTICGTSAAAQDSTQTLQQAVDGVGAAWKKAMAASVQADVKGRTVQSGKLCAAVVSLTAPKAENAGNPILSQIMNRYMQRDPSVLQIGMAR
ncbi:hypothetical protein N7373_06825 [Achromobacter mucicolens]|uniref:hypothetical protein n=1 Tax=Achromobacter mucicolens TaxID=1389922 RepID=UPI00244709B2|nr:hypothetical protein [Achromobacter mucicolens]MDH0091153.1 hypothetical protein [Achromobacter mucicolens]